MINVYVELEKIRFRNKLEFSLQVSEDILEKNPYIPAMILQPLIENSITHGISNKPEGGKVQLEIFVKNGSLQVIIGDDGIGRKAAQQIKKKRPQNFEGISAINTKQRIEILRKSGYKEAFYKMEDLFDSSGNAIGTKGIVSLPLKNQYDQKN
ncbi:hypothetical protein [Aquimarina sp. RZ0]|uniref:hypothetical protein n=1 Tax=Aquimarina sp. RZ0 TaxID=2607730 RepID=UPI0011F1AE44|nr:hypothetical protein [Aquimarina sp. RZ0]KAA1245020.1 hypothetical protein F0000_14190 [Aquimarina sp. RZ0]